MARKGAVLGCLLKARPRLARFSSAMQAAKNADLHANLSLIPHRSRRPARLTFLSTTIPVPLLRKQVQSSTSRRTHGGDRAHMA
uniref:Uncharacterized protein n=1 Tax=Aegilops tauschii subsp. strangulata TaxID=200361 RepID=A0A453SG64_AEGTS